MVGVGGVAGPVALEQTGQVSRDGSGLCRDVNRQKTTVAHDVPDEIPDFGRSPFGFSTKRVCIVLKRCKIGMSFVPQFRFPHPQTAGLYAGGCGQGSDRD